MALLSVQVRWRLLLLGILIGAVTGLGQTRAADQQKEYRLIAATLIATFERELNEAAQQGFRVEILAQSMRASSLAVLAVRTKADAKQRRAEYRLLEWDQFKKQKEELGRAGFAYRGSLLAPALFGIGAPPLILLERPLAAASSPMQFQLVESNKEKKLQRALNDAAPTGFAPVDAFPAQLLLQSVTASSTAPPKREYRYLDVYRMPTLAKEMNSAAKSGYRFALSGALNAVIMWRDPSAPVSKGYEYRLAALADAEKSRRELAALADAGCQFLGITQLGLTAIFECQTGSSAPNKRMEFKLLETNSGATMEQELARAVAQGFVPLSLGHGAKGWLSILLSREKSPAVKD